MTGATYCLALFVQVNPLTLTEDSIYAQLVIIYLRSPIQHHFSHAKGKAIPSLPTPTTGRVDYLDRL